MWTRWLGMFALCPLAMGCHLANNAEHNRMYEAKLTLPPAQTTEPPLLSTGPVAADPAMLAPVDIHGLGAHKGSTLRPQISTRFETALGAPVSPQEFPARLPLHEPTQIRIASLDVPAERPGAASEPVWIIDVMTPTKAVAPPAATVLRGLIAPKEMAPSRKTAPARARGGETEQVLVFPAGRAAFGPPVPIVVGWTSTD